MAERMKSLEHLSPDTKFIYWVEGFLRSRLRAEKLIDLMNDYDEGKLTLPYDEIEKALRKI